MKVSWVTSSSNSPSIVEYGIGPGSYNMVAYGDSSSYTFLFYKSGLNHHVIIGSDSNPLEDDTIYYYRCGGAGKEYSFKTPPASGPEVPITFAVVGKFVAQLFGVSSIFTQSILLSGSEFLQSVQILSLKGFALSRGFGADGVVSFNSSAHRRVGV